MQAAQQDQASIGGDHALPSPAPPEQGGGEFKAGDGEVEMTQMAAEPTATRPAGGECPMVEAPPQQPPRPPGVHYKGMTISVAASKGDLPHVVLLWGMASAQNVNIMRPDVEGNNPMHYAALAESPEVASFIMQQSRGIIGPGLPLLHVRNADGETPLLRAAGAGYVPTIKFLLENGSHLLVADGGNGNTVLHNAARNGHLWALAYIIETATRAGLTKEALRQFLEAPDKEDHTCLEWACYQGHLPVVEYLIRKGVNPNHADLKGRNCLHLAARQFKAPVVRFLVTKMKMSPRLADMDGRDAYWYAKGDSDVVEALRAKPSQGNEEEETALQRPIRRNTPRLRMVLSYATVSLTLWLLPFFLAWYAYLPILAATIYTYRRMFLFYDNYYDANTSNNPEIPPRKMTPFGQWVTAHEAFMGFWFGTFVAFLFTYPVLAEWPSSQSWSMQKEVATSALHGILSARVATHGAPTVTPALIAVFYVSMSVAIMLWLDLVLLRPDPGTLLYDANNFDEFVSQVAASGVPPPINKACYTCAVKKPLRSKHCAHCGFCIPRMDHHCIWLDNCVGQHNHLKFVAFVLLHVLSCTIYVVFAICFLRDAVVAELAANGRNDACQVVRVLFLRPIFPLLCLSTFSLACAGGLFFLFGDQVGNIVYNITTNEKINFRRYPWLVSTEGRFQNRFDRGVVANVLEFLGHAAYRRDYSLAYDMPPLSEMVVKKKSCKDGRCCPPPPPLNGPGASLYPPMADHHHDTHDMEAPLARAGEMPSSSSSSSSAACSVERDGAPCCQSGDESQHTTTNSTSNHQAGGGSNSSSGGGGGGSQCVHPHHTHHRPTVGGGGGGGDGAVQVQAEPESNMV